MQEAVLTQSENRRRHPERTMEGTLEGFSVRRHIERWRDVTDVVISLYHLSFVGAGQLEAVLFKDCNVRGHFVLAGTVLVKSDGSKLSNVFGRGCSAPLECNTDQH